MLLPAMLGLGAILLGQPAAAKITAEDEAAVPPDVLAAYIEARGTDLHGCSRISAVNLADRQLSELTDRIRLKYKADFDAPRDEDIVLVERNCSSPEDLPDFYERLNSHWKAIVKLGRLLDCHATPVDGFLACDELEASQMSNQ